MIKDYFSLSFCVLLLFGITFSSCSSFKKWNDEHRVQAGKAYVNPVLDTILADPTVIKDPISGDYFAYGTEDNWDDGEGGRLIPIMRSKDLVNWHYEGTAFEKKPQWKKEGGLWAPDANVIGDKVYLYYSFSTWGDANPGIGLAIADSPSGPFIDQGKIFLSDEVNVPNSIDPFYMVDNGVPYLFWGSYSNAPTQGTYGIELTPDGKAVKDFSKKFKIAAGDFEAVMIHKRGDYYYFFGSKENCCEGSNSKYQVRVARSTQLTGPYFDRQGFDIRERGNGTLLVQSGDPFVGPGHNSELIQDKDGNDWMLYHGIHKDHGKLKNGTSRRVLLMDRIKWDDGWPTIENGVPSSSPQKAPQF